MREYARTHKMYRVVANREQRQRSPPAPRAGALASFALLLELDDRSVRRDLDLAFDDGAFGDGDGARTDAASDHRRVADLKLVLDDQSARDFTRNDGLLGVNHAMPAGGDGKVKGALQFPVAVNFAGNYEVTLAPNIADDDGAGAYDSRRCKQPRGQRRTLQKSTLRCVHPV